jgi:hypothetical protein
MHTSYLQVDVPMPLPQEGILNILYVHKSALSQYAHTSECGTQTNYNMQMEAEKRVRGDG